MKDNPISMFKEDNFEEKFSVRFIQNLNRHLPKKRKTLKDLLTENKPCVENLDGTVHSFDRNELEKLASLIPAWEHDKLRLPIYLEMRSSMERGAIKISGRIECMLINRILHGDEKPKEVKDSLIIYYPHLPKIRKELSTTTQFMFTTG